jgi:SAM-dependent methyltransferase
MIDPQPTDDTSPNIDHAVVAGFGDEWARFDQTALSTDEFTAIAQAYFDLFPWSELPPGAEGFDLGCGSGRWARYVAPRVGTLHCIDPSEKALAVARRQVGAGARFHLAAVDAIPLADGSQDFGYSLGVLHHVPDTALGIRQCVAKLKEGAPFLLYLYYGFDNRPAWFRLLHRLTQGPRAVISRLPFPVRHVASQIIATIVYWPLARTARLLASRGVDIESFPLSAYRDASFYVMRTDALDRFGTRLEQRFTREEIRQMMEAAGLVDIRFGESVPYWRAIGRRGPTTGQHR